MQEWSFGILVRGPNGLQPSPSRLKGLGETVQEAEKDVRDRISEEYPDDTVYLDPEDIPQIVEIEIVCDYIVVA